jgi:hypothetical protein
LAEPLFFSDVSFAINENDKIALMGKMEQEVNASQDYCWAKQTVNRKYLHQKGCGSLFASAFIGY